MIKGAAVQKWFISTKMSQGEVEFLDSVSYLSNNNGEKSRHYLEPRIVMQGITGVDEKFRLKATLLEPGVFCAHSINYVRITQSSNSYTYVLSILNSRLLNWLFKKTSTNSNVNSYEINSLPIPIATAAKQANFETLANDILTQKRVNPAANTLALEAEIDLLVYRLYGLTYAEVRLVDPAFALSAAEYEQTV